MHKLPLLVGTVVLLATGICEARDQQRPMLPDAKLSLSDAIVAAEAYARGRAIRADYEQQKDGHWVYDVKIRAGASLREVRIDPDKGSVVNTRDLTKEDDDGDDDLD